MNDLNRKVDTEIYFKQKSREDKSVEDQSTFYIDQNTEKNQIIPQI